MSIDTFAIEPAGKRSAPAPSLAPVRAGPITPSLFSLWASPDHRSSDRYPWSRSCQT